MPSLLLWSWNSLSCCISLYSLHFAPLLHCLLHHLYRGCLLKLVNGLKCPKINSEFFVMCKVFFIIGFLWQIPWYCNNFSLDLVFEDFLFLKTHLRSHFLCCYPHLPLTGLDFPLAVMVFQMLFFPHWTMDKWTKP